MWTPPGLISGTDSGRASNFRGQELRQDFQRFARFARPKDSQGARNCAPRFKSPPARIFREFREIINLQVPSNLDNFRDLGDCGPKPGDCFGDSERRGVEFG